MRQIIRKWSICLFAVLVLTGVGCKHRDGTLEFTIHYESEHGTVPQDKTVEVGYKLTEEDLLPLEAEGYTFNGWNKVVGFEVVDDITITASWEEKESGNPANGDPNSDPQNDPEPEKKASATLNLTFTVNDITVTPTESGYFLILTPAAGFETYTWTLNQQEPDESCTVDAETHVLKFNKFKAGYGEGGYVFTLKAVKNGITYTTSAEYYVEHAPTETGKWGNSTDAYYSIIDGVVHVYGTGAMTVGNGLSGWDHIPDTLNVKNYIIEDGITEIGGACFKDFNNLETISGGNDVTIIRMHAFEGAMKLNKIHGFANLTKIEDWAFSECGNFGMTVEFGGTEEQWNAISLEEDGNDCFNDATITYNN